MAQRKKVKRKHKTAEGVWYGFSRFPQQYEPQRCSQFFEVRNIDDDIKLN
jgi:hypothetical protein